METFITSAAAALPTTVWFWTTGLCMPVAGIAVLQRGMVWKILGGAVYALGVIAGTVLVVALESDRAFFVGPGTLLLCIACGLLLALLAHTLERRAHEREFAGALTGERQRARCVGREGDTTFTQVP